MKPKNCMKNSVRYAPTRRDAKRAAKSARPQHTAPVNPRITPKEFSTNASPLGLIILDYFLLSTNSGRLFAFWLQTEDGHYFLQILPHFSFRVWISQKGLRRAASQAANYFRPDHVNLAEKKRRAGRDFILFRKAIFRRAAFHHVADVNIFAAQAHGFDHLREQFSCTADERLAFDIFVVAGTFAHEDQF